MSKNKIKVKKSFAPVMLAAVVLMFLAMILMPMIALAADICAKDEIVLQVPIPGIPGIGYCVKGFPEYLEAIYNLFVGASGILAVIMIMFGGFQWLIAGGNPTKIAGAKTTILSALAGLTLVLASYTILNLINPDLTKLADLNKIINDEKYKINPQGVSGGYCTQDMKLANNLTGDNAMCGQSYSLYASPSATCKGVKCKNEWGLWKDLTSLVHLTTKTWDVCFGGQSDYCADSFDLGKVAADAGYDNKPVYIKLSGTKLLPTPGADALYCGRIYYHSALMPDPDGDRLLIGAYCAGIGFCIIDPAGGYGINVAKDKVDGSVANSLVGQFNNTHCY
ncbi:MAG: hypothetical protein UV02_C0054G0002 [Candidatus Kuenenbacteria bacterium GW2011_GWA2_42_15]|uniref:Uncharacterized protein n=1 Tax=Candidatus Kuenenbacteria bacterium GW2011_GWA2_42_15 TaxID=1618677 RepID=A0A0G0YT84_9BACT|nr:MAG: hypothetical protein UV02_C0054G0002 [Candidatus Kuenenbacteria bacterium GW2011_GWA2_42_15]